MSLLLGLLAATPALGDRLLDPAQIRPVGATIARQQEAAGPGGVIVRISHPSPERFPGVQLTPRQGQGPWDLSAYTHLVFRIANRGATGIAVNCRADSPALQHDGVRHSVTARLPIQPGDTAEVRLPLTRLEPWVPPEQLFGMWALPAEAFGDARERVDAARIIRLHVFLIEPSESAELEIGDITAAGRYEPPTTAPAPAASFFPMVDRYGQFVHRQWPGKIHSDADLRDNVAREGADLAANPPPAGWDEFGGRADGPRLQATGYFRTDKHDGKWWLITPTGRLYWAHAINAVGEHDYTPIDERGHWFAEFPGAEPAFAGFVRQAPIPVVRGHYKDRRPMTFSFHQANLQRKYGPQWQAAYAELAHRRLRSWGFNAIGVWSERDIIRHADHRTPYFALVSSARAPTIAGSTGWWLKFPDPFHPDFKQRIVQQMEHLRQQGITNDPWCIGFFVDNELTWKHDTYLAEAALQSPPDQPAKRELVNDLKRKYDTIDALNKAWGTDHVSWDALLNHRELPAAKDRSADDLRHFYARVAEAYFVGSREAVKQVAPNHLYLGCRFPYQVNRLVTDAAKRSCDVMSVNWYQYSVDGFEVPGGLDLPLIIGEFHFGALDRGLFHTGLKAVADQDARAQAYVRYVEGALAHPNIVGVTWFKFSDEPNTGRWLDTENYQIGFLDVCDTPYPETVAAARSIARQMYDKRTRD